MVGFIRVCEKWDERNFFEKFIDIGSRLIDRYRR